MPNDVNYVQSALLAEPCQMLAEPIEEQSRAEPRRNQPFVRRTEEAPIAKPLDAIREQPLHVLPLMIHQARKVTGKGLLGSANLSEPRHSKRPFPATGHSRMHPDGFGKRAATGTLGTDDHEFIHQLGLDAGNKLSKRGGHSPRNAPRRLALNHTHDCDPQDRQAISCRRIWMTGIQCPFHTATCLASNVAT